MSDTPYQIHDRRLLKAMTKFHAGFQPPHVVLEGLTEAQATAKPHGVPHSIAEIVSHMLYWQEFFGGAAIGPFPDLPEHAAEGWPPMPAGGWESLRREFLESCKRMESLAESCARLDARLLPEGVDLPPLARDSVGSGLLHGAVHSAHHLGQIVTLRQLMGLWPPPAGSMTW